MKSFLFYEYFATGEGWSTEIFYTDDYRVTDEIAIEAWKARFDPHFHCCLRVYTFEEARADANLMRKLAEHVPKFHSFIAEELDGYTYVDYKHHENFA